MRNREGVGVQGRRAAAGSGVEGRGVAGGGGVGLRRRVRRRACRSVASTRGLSWVGILLGLGGGCGFGTMAGGNQAG